MKGLEIKEIRNNLGMTQKEFGSYLKVSYRAVQTWEDESRPMPENVQDLLKLKINTKKDTLSVSEVGVPFYDIEFTAGFLEVENNQQIKPDSYINHPFFKGCDYVVRASGQSMAKVIKHGDAIGLIKLANWMNFIPNGEIYAIVTKDGHRLIKVVVNSVENESLTLISKPSDSKIDEFPPQNINKKDILAIYKVQATSHLF